MSKGIVSALIFLFAFRMSLAAGKNNEEPKPAQSAADLRQQLEQILKDTHTPGVSVAIVRKDGPEWVAGVGSADVASNRPAGADTLFRIGSTSKAFAALSILKLAREGKLSLDDPIRKYVPDMTFQNRWEATDPVRVVNLLEHTTGWDDMHVKEYAKDAPGIDLRTALAYGAKSRVSRWPPGTRMAYCNTGPTVAAYIVEKITGQRFEDYVQQNLFGPIGMKSATYFEPPAGTGTTLYHDDGKTPYPYWNIIYRPAGAINASADDMAPYVQFYLNRGTVNGVVVTPAAEIDRMESPASTWAAKDGLRFGYGLSNYWSIHDGFVYHGHNGGVDGGLTELAYMPDNGVGYFFSINSGNGDAFWRISKAIRNYITLKMEKPAVPAPGPLPSDASDYAGWYEPDAPRQQMYYFTDRIKELARVRFESGKMIITTGLSRKQVFVPVSGRQFRFVPEDGPPEPVASAVLLTPNSEGQFIDAGTTLKHLPAWVALAEVGLLAFFDLAMIAVVAYAPFWIIGGFFKKRRRPLERAMRLYPLAAVLSLIACVMIFNSSGNDYINRLGHLTPWSAGIFLTTLAFAVTTIMGIWSAATVRPPLVRPAVRWFSIAVSVALLIALVYFAYWGVIGIRTWA
jgi:CubicO group peptidase (beta-lactamase class C family)